MKVRIVFVVVGMDLKGVCFKWLFGGILVNRVDFVVFMELIYWGRGGDNKMIFMFFSLSD